MQQDVEPERVAPDRLDTEQPLRHDQVPVAGDGKEFGDALRRAEDDRVEHLHETAVYGAKSAKGTEG